MKHLITLIIFILSTSIATGAPKQSQVEILLIERDPWLMVIGSDSPTFALYDTGQAIWWHQIDNTTGEYRSANLNQTVLAELNSSAIALNNLDKYYELSSWTDQPTQAIYYRVGTDLKQIAVYGQLRAESEDRAKAPKSFLKFFDRLAHFEHSDSIPWKPKLLEVMIWPYEYAPEESIVWPHEWPDINDENTEVRGDSYSIYLPIKYEDEFKSFIRTQNKKGAVLINGRKWAVSTRIPFPHEVNIK